MTLCALAHFPQAVPLLPETCKELAKMTAALHHKKGLAQCKASMKIRKSTWRYRCSKKFDSFPANDRHFIDDPFSSAEFLGDEEHIANIDGDRAIDGRVVIEIIS